MPEREGPDGSPTGDPKAPPSRASGAMARQVIPAPAARAMQPAAIPAPLGARGTRPVIQAIAISLSALFLLDCMGLIVKLLSERYPAIQLAVFRNLFGLVPAALMLTLSRPWHRAGRPLLMRQWRLGLLRGLFVAGAQACFYLALGLLAFATAATLAFAMPLFVTALSVPLLGDRVGPWRWAAVAIGFAGVVMVMGPGTDAFGWEALLPIGAALAYAVATVTVGRIDAHVPSPLVNLYGQVGALAGTLVLTLAGTGFVPIASATDLAWIAAMGVLGGTGVTLLIVAYRSTEPANLAPFDYCGILFAFTLGWLAFGEAPVDRLFPGVLLIVGGGLLIVWRESRTARRSRTRGG